ncbi:MAG: hypothetical protein IJ088_16510, partial [Clostridia bacterium]|nr:hypothetical protein [Clostridia bacterium]
QSVERILGKDEVTSSILVISSTEKPGNKDVSGLFLILPSFPGGKCIRCSVVVDNRSVSACGQSCHLSGTENMSIY